MERKLVVLGIPWDVDTDGLKEYMIRFGELEDCIVMKDCCQSSYRRCLSFVVSTFSRSPPLIGEKVRVQTKPGFAKGLSDGLPKIVKAEGFGGLYRGLVPLWGRQIPYTMMKFATFENIVEQIYKNLIPRPKHECSSSLQLGVSFGGGYIAGVFCAIVSHPADNLVSFLNNAQGASVADAVKKLGLWGLFTRGLPLRIVMIGTLTSAQWGIYDAFKVFVGLGCKGNFFWSSRSILKSQDQFIVTSMEAPARQQSFRQQMLKQQSFRQQSFRLRKIHKQVTAKRGDTPLHSAIRAGNLKEVLRILGDEEELRNLLMSSAEAAMIHAVFR